MNFKRLVGFGLLIALAPPVFVSYNQRSKTYGAPPYEDGMENFQGSETPFDDYSNWKRPDGPIRIGLQAGHWKTDEMPEEQAGIRDSGGGTSSQGVAEWEVTLIIAQETAKILEEKGYVVDVLPATIPESYWADAFVSIHADGNLNPWVSGFKVAASQRDRTGVADELAQAIQNSYQESTSFDIDPNISRDMTRYYAFNSRRYKYALHPMTPGVIIETGFLTNPANASILLNNPEIPAEGIANGIINFISKENLSVLLNHLKKGRF